MGQKAFCGLLRGKNVTFINKEYHTTEKLKDIMYIFFLDEVDVEKILKFFNSLDKENKGYITLNHIYNLIKESPLKSDMCPYIEHFFNIIDKKFHNKITFEEFLPYLISYCICSTYQLIEFIFGLIDNDHDKYISLLQIEQLFQTKKNNEEIFFINHQKRLGEYYMKSIIRSDRLGIEDFVKLCNDLPFIYYPAVKLQKKLRKYYISKSFWNNLEQKIKKKYIDNITNKVDLKLQVNIDDIRNKVIEERIKQFKKRWETEKKDKLNREIYKEKIRLQKPRRNSDTEVFREKFKKKPLEEDAKSIKNVEINIKIKDIFPINNNHNNDEEEKKSEI